MVENRFDGNRSRLQRSTLICLHVKGAKYVTTEAIALLSDAVARQRAYVDAWRKPSEPTLLETVRSIDKLMMIDLVDTRRATTPSPPQLSIASWGINHALERVVPRTLSVEPFRIFPSTPDNQDLADEFLFQCGVLHRAELLLGWLREGLLSARIDTPQRAEGSDISAILVLKTADPSLFAEVAGHTHRQWMADLTLKAHSSWERDLEERHLALRDELRRCVIVLEGWTLQSTSTPEIDAHFNEWARLYLKRMWGSDLLGPDDIIGGAKFSEYLTLVTALSARAQRHLCYTYLIKHDHPELDIRNLLTTFVPCREFIASLAKDINADGLHVQRLLNALTLDADNLERHTSYGDIAYAPVIQSSANFYIIPQYGMDINPFLFLMRDLEARYPRDWSRAANGREARWIDELRAIFPPPRWRVHTRNMKLMRPSGAATDIDFIAYDTATNEVALFQLKWQQPAWHDHRARRSAGRNLVTDANKWISVVHDWLAEHGADELMRRAGISARAGVAARLFVIARYNAFFSGYGNRDDRAVWADWNHLVKVRVEATAGSASEISALLTKQTAAIAAAEPGDAYMIPLGNLAVILNPSSEPSSRSEHQ